MKQYETMYIIKSSLDEAARNAVIEEKMLADHPELAADRANAYYWNFLPPAELEKLLSLYHTVSKKTLRISKTFGIEGKKLLTPDDDASSFFILNVPSSPVLLT